MPSAPSIRVKPPALRPGDTIGIVAPASNVDRTDFEAGCEALRKQGYLPFYFDSIFEQDLYFAGTLDRRLNEFHEMFLRDEVRAVMCARGGYGANYLLPALDLALIKSHPKILIGYSDVTPLLTLFADSAGLATFHGPMVAKDWNHADGVDLASWQAALSGSESWEVLPAGDSSVATLVEGSATGRLYGGCLSLLVASLGTPYEIETAGTILFIEDVAAKPYQIDRMLMQLKLSGKFEDVRGIVFGQMIDCIQTAHQGYTLKEVIVRILGDLGVPIAYGLHSGHVTSGNITLPIGVQAELAARGGNVSLRIVEPAVTR